MSTTSNNKVLLISPPRTASIDSGVYPICEPLGLAYLAGVLEKNGFSVQILDCFILGQNIKITENNLVRVGIGEEEIKKLISDSGAKIIGITNMFTSLSCDSMRIAALAKQVFPDALIVMGGAHATFAYDLILSDKNVDIVVLGEGEETFLDIVNQVGKGKVPMGIKGTAERVGDKIVLNPEREHIDNLDELPSPSRHLLPMREYFRFQEVTTYVFAMRYPVATIITSRGCPYDCIFCSTSKVWKRRWRARSPENIVDEIESLVKDYAVKEIAFEDDNFIVDQKRVKEICDEIIKRKLKIKWSVPSGLSIWLINKEMLKKMKKAGFYRLAIPIESASPKTLKFIRKPIDLVKALEMIKFSNRIGLWTIGNFIIGFPDESPADIDKTIRFANKSGLDMAIFYIAQPFAGSDLHSLYEQRGLLKVDLENNWSSMVDSVYDTAHFKARELVKLRAQTIREYLQHRYKYYLNPVNFLFYLLPKINSLEKVRYFFKLAGFLRKTSR